MDTLHSVYVDLHIHIGRTEAGQAVKISAANNLTFYNIAHEASERKGIEVIGIIDCHSPGVQREIRQYVKSGEMRELQGEESAIIKRQYFSVVSWKSEIPEWDRSIYWSICPICPQWNLLRPGCVFI